MTLEQISQDLKISPAYLGHVEAGDPSKLPQAPYFDLFARSYASLLGVDYDATVRAIKDELSAAEQARLEEEAAAAGPAKKRPGGAHALRATRPEGTGKSWKTMYAVGGAVLLAIIAVGTYLLFFRDKPAPSIKPAEEVTEVTRPAAPPANPDESDQMGYDYPANVYPEQQELALRLITSGQSRVKVQTDGKTALDRLLHPNLDSTITAMHHLQVTVGTPAAVRLILNGQEVDLRDSLGNITEVEITPLNLEQILAGVRPELTSNSRLGPELGTTDSERQSTADENVLHQGDQGE